MNYRVFCGCLLTSAVAFAVVLGMIYCAGRWLIMSGPELLFGDPIGIGICILGCAAVLRRFEARNKRRRLVAYWLTIGLLLAYLFESSALKMLIFTAGFEHTVLTVASAEQWESILFLADQDRKRPPSGQVWEDAELLPEFVWKVDPGGHPSTFILDEAAGSEDLHVLIFWRSASYNPALEIGKVGPHEPLPDGVLFQRKYSDYITFMLLQ